MMLKKMMLALKINPIGSHHSNEIQSQHPMKIILVHVAQIFRKRPLII